MVRSLYFATCFISLFAFCGATGFAQLANASGQVPRVNVSSDQKKPALGSLALPIAAPLLAPPTNSLFERAIPLTTTSASQIREMARKGVSDSRALDLDLPSITLLEQRTAEMSKKMGKLSESVEFVVQFDLGVGADADTDAPIGPAELNALREATTLDLSFVRVTRTGGQVLRVSTAMGMGDATRAIQKMRRVPKVLWAEINLSATSQDSERIQLSPKASSEVAEELVDKIIVRLRNVETIKAAERNEVLSDAWLLALSNISGVKLGYVAAMSGGAHVLSLPTKVPLSAAHEITTKLEADASVRYADPVTMAQTQAVPTDPRYAQQWHYFEPVGGINAPRAWDISTGSPNLVVAVLDTGILFDHPDLAGRTVPGYNMISDAARTGNGIGRSPVATDLGTWSSPGECGPGSGSRTSNWHGTHVAGTIGAATNNGVGVSGVNWNSKILPVRVLGKCGGQTPDIADGIAWAAGIDVPGVPRNPYPAKVINLSLGGLGSCSSSEQSAINQALSAGATVVVAAGNGDTKGNGVNVSTARPANCNGVISVAANTRLGDKAGYSNFGAGITVSAPGGAGETPTDDVASTTNAGQTTASTNLYDYSNGTSMAAPHVAGIASLLLSVNPSLTPSDVRILIAANARPFPVTTSCARLGDCGTGISDAARVLIAATGPALYFDLPQPLFNAQSQPILFYGSRLIGTTTTVTARIINSGLFPLAITNVSRSGQFDGTTTCIGATLQPGISCTLNVTFLPATIGNALGNITITSNAFGSPHDMVLVGIAIPPNSPGISASTYNVPYAPQGINTTSASKPIIITNNGTANLVISNATVSAGFGGTSTCIGATVVPNGTCRIDATFQPTAIGPRSGAINLFNNVPGSPLVISLAGLGVGSPVASFSQGSLSFGSQAVGATSAPQTVTLTNTGTATLYIASAALTGDFSFVASNCGETLSVASSCTASFAFAPTAAGTRTGSIALATNAPNSPQSVSFSGAGVASAAINLIAPVDGATVAGKSVSLEWGAVAGAGAYSIKLTDTSTGNTFSFPLRTTTATGIINLALSTTYRWTVASCANTSVDNSTNCPNVSSPRTFRTLSAQLQLSRRGGIDVDGNGKSAILVRSASAQLQAGRFVNNQFQFTAVSDPGPSFRLVGVGDFFNSGRSDLAFQNMSQGTFGDIKIWRGFSSANEVFWRQVKQVWDVQAGGDLDGDGFGDLVWRYVVTESPDTGVSYIWFTNGSAVTQVRKRGGAPLNWTLLGAADLNGDGAGDMVYVSPANQARALMATPNRTCANVLIGNIPSNLTALKLADFTGNGRGDILMRDSGAGLVSLMSLDATSLSLPPYTGAADDQNASCTGSSLQVISTTLPLITVDSSWQFYASGDFNGDGIMDVVWKRPDGTLTLWLMNRNGAMPTVIGNAGASPAGFAPMQP